MALIIPQEWLSHRAAITERLKAWEAAKRNNQDGSSLTEFCWSYACGVDRDGGGLLFLDFSERRQRAFLKPEFFEWVKMLADDSRRRQPVR